MAEEVEVHLHLDHVLMRVQDATEKGLAAIAHQVEAHAKARIQANNQIDTGFMLNAVYSVTKQGSGFGEAEGAAKARADREVVNEDLSMDDAAMVVAGANYSIYQEARQTFLFGGALDTAADSAAMVEVERVFKEENHD